MSKLHSFGWFGLLVSAGCGQAPAPAPVSKKPRAPVEQTEFCLPEVLGGVLIETKDRAEQLGCLLDEDIMKADFDKQSVGLFRRTVPCNGTAKLEDQVVYWTDFGVCGADQETVLDFVAFFDKGNTFTEKKVDFSTRPESRTLAMTRLSEYARDDTLLHFRRAVNPTALEWSLTEGDKTLDWKRAVEDITLEEIKNTLLYRRVIVDFDCSQPPKDGSFVCTASGSDYKVAYTVAVMGSRFRLLKMDETIVAL